MQTQRCDFPTALRYVADYAGIPLPPRDGGHNYTRQIERKRHQRERIERSGEWLAEMERSIRLQCRDKIHECDRILDKPGPWDEAQWQRARWALLLQREFLLPEYCLLAFGNMAERVRYVLASDAERAAMLSGVRERWGVNTESGHLMEVMG
jgi:hypothetical protein